MPVAAIGKVGLPSVSGGYGAADTLSDDRIDAIRQRTCKGRAFRLMSVFRRLAVFKLLTPEVSPTLPKNQLLEKSDPLTEKNFKISQQKDSAAHGFTYSCQVSRKSVKRN